MKERAWCKPPLLAPFLLISLLWACVANTPVHYYTLLPVKGSEIKTPFRLVAGSAIAVGPVTLPDYVDRPGIVTRSTGGEVRVAESDRWASPLEDEVTRVLAENISVLLRPRGMGVLSWRQQAPVKMRVPVMIKRMDATPGRAVRIEAQWTIRDGREAGEFPVYEETLEALLSGSDYQSIVSGISAVLGQLGERIAQSVIENLSGS